MNCDDTARKSPTHKAWKMRHENVIQVANCQNTKLPQPYI